MDEPQGKWFYSEGVRLGKNRTPHQRCRISVIFRKEIFHIKLYKVLCGFLWQCVFLKKGSNIEHPVKSHKNCHSFYCRYSFLSEKV